MHALGGLFCSGVARLAAATDTVITNPNAAAAAAAEQQQQQQQLYVQRMASLPSTAICSDTHNHFMRLLPCRQQVNIMLLLLLLLVFLVFLVVFHLATVSNAAFVAADVGFAAGRAVDFAASLCLGRLSL